MGQALSGPEGVAVAKNKYGEDSTDSVSNYLDDDDDAGSSLDSSSSVDSSRTMDSYVEGDQEQAVETNENAVENITTTTTTTTTSTPQKHENETKSTNPSRPLLLEPSTPAQWIVWFRTSTDEELVSLLEEGCNVDDHNLNYCDLSPLCAEIRSMATKIAEYRVMEKSLAKIGSIHSPKNTDASTVSFYDIRSTKRAMDENDDDLIDLCERILNASSSRYVPPRGKNRRSNKGQKPMYTLSRVRQKLVPSKLKEHIFWESLWVILYERKSIRAEQAFFQSIETTTNAHEKKSASNLDIMFQLQTAKDCISEFKLRYQEETKKREQMESLVAKMWETMPKNYEEEKKSPTASPPKDAPKVIPCVKFGGGTKDSTAEKEEEDAPDETAETKPKAAICKHTGTWIMSADSIEFLAFPSEAKEALRTEKQKRLKRVKEEMAFILDSDHPQDSHGEWSCCHKTNYHDACG